MIADHEIADESWGGAVRDERPVRPHDARLLMPRLRQALDFLEGIDGPPVAYAPEH